VLIISYNSYFTFKACFIAIKLSFFRKDEVFLAWKIDSCVDSQRIRFTYLERSIFTVKNKYSSIQTLNFMKGAIKS